MQSKVNGQGKKSKTLSEVESVLHLLNTVESTHSRKYSKDDILCRARQFWDKNSENIEKINLLDMESSETTCQTREQPIIS